MSGGQARALGELIRKRRIDFRTLQKAVAPKLEVNIETLKNRERGAGTLSIRQIPAIIELHFAHLAVFSLID